MFSTQTPRVQPTTGEQVGLEIDRHDRGLARGQTGRILGTDTVSPARSITGLDFSPSAVIDVRRLAVRVTSSDRRPDGCDLPAAGHLRARPKLIQPVQHSQVVRSQHSCSVTSRQFIAVS
jgi:hypothetical protein